jgi:hypothetical protein
MTNGFRDSISIAPGMETRAFHADLSKRLSKLETRDLKLDKMTNAVFRSSFFEIG